MYKVKISAKAKKQLKKISKVYNQQAIFAILEELKEYPFSGKPLSRELIGKYSYKVGVYRIIYTVNEKDKAVFIINVGHRSTVYQ